MSPEMSQGIVGKSNTIRHIVRLRQMLRRWRRKAAASSSSSVHRIPYDVPAGHVAIYVGSECKRFVVRATYLNHPIFKKLLVQAEEEYGFSNEGPLTIPCEEAAFEEILRSVSRAEPAGNSARFINLNGLQRCCQASFRKNCDIFGESLPLLQG